MRGRYPGGRLVAAVAVVAFLGSGLAPATLAHPHEEELDGGTFVPPSADSPVRLEDIRFDAAGVLSGVVVNRSSSALRDVRLLVRYDWHWRNEQNPGDYSPASSTYFTVPGDVPALGSLPFRFAPTSPLPIRDDGYFSPTVEVAGYTQVGSPQGADHPR